MSTGFSASGKPTVADYQSLDVNSSSKTNVYLSPRERTDKGCSPKDRHNLDSAGPKKRAPERQLNASLNSGNGKSTSVVTLDSRCAVVLGFVFTACVVISIGTGVLAGIALQKASVSSPASLQSSEDDTPQNRTETISAQGKSDWQSSKRMRNCVVFFVRHPPTMRPFCSNPVCLCPRCGSLHEQ